MGEANSQGLGKLLPGVNKVRGGIGQDWASCTDHPWAGKIRSYPTSDFQPVREQVRSCHTSNAFARFACCVVLRLVGRKVAVGDLNTML